MGIIRPSYSMRAWGLPARDVLHHGSELDADCPLTLRSDAA